MKTQYTLESIQTEQGYCPSSLSVRQLDLIGTWKYCICITLDFDVPAFHHNPWPIVIFCNRDFFLSGALTQQWLS